MHRKVFVGHMGIRSSLDCFCVGSNFVLAEREVDLRYCRVTYYYRGMCGERLGLLSCQLSVFITESEVSLHYCSKP